MDYRPKMPRFPESATEHVSGLWNWLEHLMAVEPKATGTFCLRELQGPQGSQGFRGIAVNSKLTL